MISTNPTPLISIVTVCKNDLFNLQRTVFSVMPYLGELELIIKDGLSTDGTIAWLETLHKPQITVILGSDTGIYDAMNEAIEHCGGQYIWFINAGDTIVSAGINQLIKCLRYSQFVVIKCLVETEGRLVRRERASIWYFTRRMLNHQGLIYSGEVLRRNSFDSHLAVIGDLKHLIENDLWHSISYFDELCVQYLGGGFAARLSSIRRNWQERLTVWRWKNVRFNYKVVIYLTALLGCLYWWLKEKAHLFRERAS